MLTVFEKSQALKSVYAQMFIIVIAFLIMGISSFLFTRRIEHRHLVKHAESALDLTEAKIIGSLSEHETLSDIELAGIYKQAATIDLTEGSYGILLNNELEILVHPISNFIGRKLYDIDSDIAALSDELAAGLNIYERRIRNFLYENSVVYFRKTKNDLFLGIVIPENEYYRSVTNSAVFIIIIGSLLAWGLCIMLYYISKAKTKSEIKTLQKSNFLAAISHEIRTPLNAILGITDIQILNSTHPPTTSEAFIKIRNSGNLLLNIINDILDLSKIEAGKLELIPVKYEVTGLINDIIQLNYIRYQNKPIEFKVEVDENIPLILIGDELRIKQILNNLLSNAFKYTEHGEVTLSVKTEYIGRSGGAATAILVCEISDTGQGMTPEQLNSLFDEYSRFNTEVNRKTEGTGLGMTITRNLVELMYGKIRVTSTAGKGTTVFLRLPQKTDSAGIRNVIGKDAAENLRQFKLDYAVQVKKAKTTHEYMPYGSVLIVDDVEINLFVAKGLMTPYGLKIDIAMNGFEAIDKIKKGSKYDIIFMDYMMPKMDGIETTKQLRKMGYTGTIVVLTANAIIGQAEVFLKNGFDDFISKPINTYQLDALLNRLIRDKQPSEVIEAARKEKAEMDKKFGSNQMYQQVDPLLGEVFARDAGKAIKNIETCMQNKFNDESDIQMYIFSTHSMKSALANIGQNVLSATALRLERAGREKDINVMLLETKEFIDNLKKLVREIELENKGKEPAEDTEDSLLFLSEKLIVIKEACDVYNKKAAKSALKELTERPWSRNIKELLNSIIGHLLHSEFDEASALVEKYFKEKD